MPTAPRLNSRHDAATGITYTIRKTVGEREYVVRFRQDNVPMPAWTCYESDHAAAVQTGDATIRHAAESAATLARIAADAAANVTRVVCTNVVMTTCPRCSSPTPADRSCDCFDNGCQ